MKPLLVGELNPYAVDMGDCHALYPSPPHCAGWRLCHLVMGLDPEEYIDRFDRANLCYGKWSETEARSRAVELREQYPNGTFVLLGRKVWRAFGARGGPFSAFATGPGGSREVYVLLPHPSGRCREWNLPGAYAKAREVLREAGVLS